MLPAAAAQQMAAVAETGSGMGISGQYLFSECCFCAYDLVVTCMSGLYVEWQTLPGGQANGQASLQLFWI